MQTTTQPNQLKAKTLGVRESAIQKGDLIDVTNAPQGPRSRLQLPTALTRAVWSHFVQPLDSSCANFRLWDILWATTTSIRQRGVDRQTVYIRIPLRDSEGLSTGATATIKAKYGYGDRGERVITIMMPDEF